jgi:hypothetical protein
MIGLLILAAVVGASTADAASAAALDPEFANVPVEQCTVQEVTSRMASQAHERMLKILFSGLQSIEELKKINNTVKDKHKKTVGEQLTSENRARWTQISLSIWESQVGAYLESKRERDARAFLRMVQLSDIVYHSGKITNVTAKDAIYVVAMEQIQHWAHQQKLNIPIPAAPAETCSLRLALSDLAFDALSKLDKELVKRDGDAIHEIARRYGGGPIDPEKLSAPDRADFLRLNQEMAKPYAAANYVQDIGLIASLSDAAYILYSTEKQDALGAGGDWKKIGQTVDKMQAAGEFSPQLTASFLVWEFVNDKIPADVGLPGASPRPPQPPSTPDQPGSAPLRRPGAP